MGQARSIAFIEDEKLIAKIFKHLGLWEKGPRKGLRVRSQRAVVQIMIACVVS
jgi:hypothetical protein